MRTPKTASSVPMMNEAAGVDEAADGRLWDGFAGWPWHPRPHGTPTPWIAAIFWEFRRVGSDFSGIFLARPLRFRGLINLVAANRRLRWRVCGW